MEASGGVVGPKFSPADETICLRCHNRMNEFTLAVDSSSAASVRVSIVEISMRWSAGLTCCGQGNAF